MVLPNTRPKSSEKSPVHLEPDKFNEFIESQGVYARITPSVLCPNRTEKFDTNHELDCSLCEGNQSYDLDSQAYEEWVFIQSLELKHVWETQGIFDIKDAKLTIRGNRRLWYYYKIEILDHTSIFNEIVKRTGVIDKLRYIPQQLASDTPLLVVDRTGVEYSLITDYTLSGQELSWVSGQGPAEGDLYSIEYPILPIFRVLEFLHENRYYYQNKDVAERKPIHMPQECVIRWDYFSKRSGANEEHPPT